MVYCQLSNRGKWNRKFELLKINSLTGMVRKVLENMEGYMAGEIEHDDDKLPEPIIITGYIHDRLMAGDKREYGYPPTELVDLSDKPPMEVEPSCIAAFRKEREKRERSEK